MAAQTVVSKAYDNLEGDSPKPHGSIPELELFLSSGTPSRRWAAPTGSWPWRWMRGRTQPPVLAGTLNMGGQRVGVPLRLQSIFW